MTTATGNDKVKKQTLPWGMGAFVLMQIEEFGFRILAVVERLSQELGA